jgi:hypothetical protein
MMKQYKMIAAMGFLIVIVAFTASLVGSNSVSTFLSVDKVTREAATAGSSLVNANVLHHSITTWVPALKFVGLGMMLAAIAMALGLVAQTLRDLGIDLMGRWPSRLNPGAPAKPRTAQVFPMLVMMGLLLLLIGFIWSVLLNGTVTAYWAHSIATELNPALAGSALLNQLGTITATLPWLEALRITGMAFILTAITLAVSVVVRTLQHQERALGAFISNASSSGV